MPDYKKNDIANFYNHIINTPEFLIWYQSTTNQNFGPHKEMFKQIQNDYNQLTVSREVTEYTKHREQLTTLMDFYFKHSKPPQGPHSQQHKQHHQQMRLPDPARPPQGPNSQPHQQYHQQHHQAAPQGPRKQMWRPDPARPDIVDSDGRWWYKHTHGGFKQYDDWYKTRGEDHLETTLDDNATAYDVPLDLTA